jgi:ribosomal protein S8
MRHQLSNIKQSFLHNSLVSTFAYTKFNLNLIKLLLKNGLISHYKRVFKNKNNYYRVFLKYYEQKNVIRDLTSIHKLRRPISTNNKNVKKLRQSLLVSTNKGFLLQSDLKQYHIGGNVFYFINC